VTVQAGSGRGRDSPNAPDQPVVAVEPDEPVVAVEPDAGAVVVEPDPGVAA
jgi:hypothetical protein